MDVAQTFSSGLEIGGAFLNLIQQLALAQRASSAGDLSGMTAGIESRIFQATTDLADGAIVTVCDTTIAVVDPLSDPIVTTTATLSWKDRIVAGFYRGYSGADQRVGQGNDYLFDAAGPPTLFMGYTGNGAKDGSFANVTAGNPPVPASGTSWAIKIATDLWLYVDPADGALKLYNATGSSIRTPLIWLFATGKTGKRP